MDQPGSEMIREVVAVTNPAGRSDIVLVCEHASRSIPAELNGLGASQDTLQSHAAWDIGAAAVAEAMSAQLDAPLVASRISRLVYDCNRPPEAADAMPEQSEIHAIPGNRHLSDAERQARVARYYTPFRKTLAETIAARKNPVIVTVHSFTPVYRGAPRDVEIGVLHDSDARLADALLHLAKEHMALTVRRNDPYGPEDGVTHTLKEHALPGGFLNVMLEIRNDLIAQAPQQRQMAAILSDWVAAALAKVKVAS